VRLALVQLAHALLTAADAAALPYGAELVELLEGALCDDAPDAAAAACAAAAALCAVAGRRLGAAAAARLTDAASPLLAHRRAAVRLAALRALDALVHAGAAAQLPALGACPTPHEVPLAAFYGDELVRVNFLGKLATDSAACVRAAYARTLGGWLLRLPERADYAPLLLPYLLSALSDAAPEAAAAAAEALDALGQAHERERAEELREAARYGCALATASTVAAADDADVPAGPRAAARRLGTRLLVQQHLGDMLPGCAPPGAAARQEVPC
jgi:hypothetical protein